MTISRSDLSKQIPVEWLVQHPMMKANPLRTLVISLCISTMNSMKLSISQSTRANVFHFRKYVLHCATTGGPKDRPKEELRDEDESIGPNLGHELLQIFATGPSNSRPATGIPTIWHFGISCQDILVWICMSDPLNFSIVCQPNLVCSGGKTNVPTICDDTHFTAIVEQLRLTKKTVNTVLVSLIWRIWNHIACILQALWLTLALQIGLWVTHALVPK